MSDTKGLLPFQTVYLASLGDIEAMRDVVRRYEPYINKLSTQPFIDPTGNIHYVVNEDIKNRLQTKLIAKVLLFRIDD